MRRINFLVIIFILFSLIGCGVEDTVKRKKRIRKKVQPVTINTAALEKQEEELKSLFEKKYIPLEYEHRKNPFRSVIEVYKENLKSDLSENPLQNAAIDQIKLVGIMEADIGNIGVVEIFGKTFYVKVGDKIGMNNGLIVEITEEVIKLRQKETDIFGNSRSELVELMMDKKEGSL